MTQHVADTTQNPDPTASGGGVPAQTPPAANTPGGGSAPAAPASPPPGDPKEKARKHLDIGQNLYRKAKFHGALAEFKRALVLDPKSAEAHRLHGDALSQHYRYSEAVAAYDEALKPENEAAEPDTRALAYYMRGDTLYYLRRFDESVEALRRARTLLEGMAAGAGVAPDRAATYESTSGDVYNTLGLTLLDLKRYDEAADAFVAASRKGAEYPYAYHNYASLLWMRGRYDEARVQWDAAYRRYDRDSAMGEAEREGWPGHFINFANMLHDVYGDLDYAERMYGRALRMMPQSAAARAGLLNLYVERAASAACRADAYAKARRVYEEAKEILLKRLSKVEDLDSMIQLGELHLAWNDYDGSGRWREEEDKLAEKYLTEALKKDESDAKRVKGYTRTAKPAASLGVVHARRKEYKKAVEFFEQALRIENDDLTLRSNLAEAYLRDKQLEEAEREYRYVLAMAPEHVESLIGLGELYLTRADAGDPDMYEQATRSFGDAVALAEKRRGSKRLKKKELAKVHYLRAYAMVKSFEGSKLLRDHNLLWSARTDFKACAAHDPEFYSALRAIEKIEKNLGARTPQRLLEKVGPPLIFLAAVSVFFLAQYFFYWGDGKLGAGEYTGLTFGSLMLMVASAYLPQILKLKLAGMELEKSNVDQLATLGTLGITRGV